MDRLFFALLACILIGCNEPSSIIDDNKPENYIRTKFTLSGEFTAMPEVPIINTDQVSSLSRTTTNDLYAVQIYSADKPSSYAKYAYGLFDNLSLAEIELSDRMYYRFVVVAFKEAKTMVQQTAGAYHDPFLVNLKPTLLDNQFAYSASAAFSGLTLGKTKMAKDLKLYDRPEADRYVGEVINFQPVKGTAVNVELKRVVFGIRLYSEDLTEGYIELTIDGAPSMFIYPETSSAEAIFTLKGAQSINNKLIEDNYTENVLCKANWHRPKLPVQVIGSAAGQQISVSRGHRRPIKVETTFPKSAISVVMESEELIDQSEIVF